MRDNDMIHAVILGTAVNHDGAEKNSYLAPSIKGQIRVIKKAQQRAQVKPETISYVEAHGTGTPVGDPIEFTALNNVFYQNPQHKNYCALGSIKANLGHPTTAAGIVGLIKCVLAMKHQKIPPLINFKALNPNIDLENSAFYINNNLIPWEPINNIRRCAISSFGFCGTNAHAILEEYKPQTKNKSTYNKTVPLFPISANTETALQIKAKQLTEFLENNKKINLTDATYTTAVGRKAMKYRGIIIAKPSMPLSIESNFKNYLSNLQTKPVLAFVFPGQGAQYMNMGKNLYATEPVFKNEIDQCAEILLTIWGSDIREVLFANTDDEVEATALLNNTYYTQPAIFCLEYALAKLLMHWEIRPQVLIGHSIGEFVCATLAGMFSLHDALTLISQRSTLVSQLPDGGMLSVKHAIDELPFQIEPHFSIAAINAPDAFVIAGENNEIDKLHARLTEYNIISKRLYTSHAFHSWMMQPALEPFAKVVNTIKFKPGKIPIISTVTGEELSQEIATNADYWVEHLRKTVNFSAAIKTLWQHENCILLEIGPRGSMASLANSQTKNSTQTAIKTLTNSAENNLESYSLTLAIGQLWMRGIDINWNKYFHAEARQRIPLPVYPFERKKYWAYPGANTVSPKNLPKEQLVMGESLHPTLPANNKEDSSLIKDEIVEILNLISGRNFKKIDDNATFFDLRIDSLLTAAFIFKLREKFNVTFSFQQLNNEFNNINKLNQYIIQNKNNNNKESRGNGQALIATDKVKEIEQDFELDNIQLLYLMRDETSSLYTSLFNKVSITLYGQISLESLKKSLSELILRHDALRMRFQPDKIKFILKQSAYSIEEPQNNNLFTTSIEITPNKADITFSAHLSICDKWSMDVLIEEFLAIYAKLLSKTVNNLQKATQYIDYIQENRPRKLNYQALQSSIARSKNFQFTIENNEFKKLKNISLINQKSPFCIFLALIAYFLYDKSGGKNNTILVPIAGQAITNNPSLVGQCTKFFGIFINELWDSDFSRFLVNINQDLLRLYQAWIDDDREIIIENFKKLLKNRPDVLMTHIQHLSLERLNYNQFQADYSFLDSNHQLFPQEYEVIEYADKITIKCNFQETLPQEALVELFPLLKSYLENYFSLKTSGVERNKKNVENFISRGVL